MEINIQQQILITKNVRAQKQLRYKSVRSKKALTKGGGIIDMMINGIVTPFLWPGKPKNICRTLTPGCKTNSSKRK
ncbi:hypothetical protein [Lactococcus cremoris]|uniref:hypothetical protein n=1 Tax=Lactococcus lactis subsp. cremoris TaxID=1359 RepID=UPI00163A4BDC|nr:hypothetical protein [Lactococcus cremoris]